MSWQQCYVPPDALLWQGRTDIPTNACLYQVMHALDLREDIEIFRHQRAFCLIGFCSDTGVIRNRGRKGAALGPRAIREMLVHLPIHRQNGIYCDAGDIVCVDDDLETAQAALAEVVALLLSHNMIPIVLGGGHELAWGHYQGIAKYFLQQSITQYLGIINFDAHFDMRALLPDDKGSSGTPFLQIAKAHELANKKLDYYCFGIQPASNMQVLFDTAKKYHAHYYLANDVYQEDTQQALNFIERALQNNQAIYASLCLDVFASAYAPGVSAPQPFGLTPWQVVPLIRHLAKSGKVVSYDIAELLPAHDVSAMTSKLAANFIYEIINHHVTE